MIKVGQHWLEVALERIKAGEPEASVLQDYGYEYTHYEPDLTKCPTCGGEADNGFDRCIPPSPYECSKCQESEDE